MEEYALPPDPTRLIAIVTELVSLVTPARLMDVLRNHARMVVSARPETQRRSEDDEKTILRAATRSKPHPTHATVQTLVLGEKIAIKMAVILVHATTAEYARRPERIRSHVTARTPVSWEKLARSRTSVIQIRA
jgi:hypothetical protein